MTKEGFLHSGSERPSSQALQSFLDALADGHLPPEEDVFQLLRDAAKHFGQLPTLVQIQVPAAATLHVVGDLHGQFCELMTVISGCGLPSEKNMFLFNGDFVDRGGRSVEVMLALLSMALFAPGRVFLNRGNHEFAYMSRNYGFEEEALQKYPRRIFDSFQTVFTSLPLASLVNQSVFVTHGGLFRSRAVRLSDVQQVDRFAPMLGEVAQDLLWSDPTNEDGRHLSQRGAGILFGPDVSEEFCHDNNLLCLIRSHEVKHRGYEWQRGGRCLTIFSAANYIGRMGNLGAVCHIKPHGERIDASDLSISTFAGAKEDVAFRDRQARIQVTFPSAPLRSRL